MQMYSRFIDDTADCVRLSLNNMNVFVNIVFVNNEQIIDENVSCCQNAVKRKMNFIL